MNPESLDSSIQGALSALYPPFEVTAPTVLSQLFQVIEERYRGDALQCLLDFLIPSKHILESVQQAACAPYSDVVFCCEGWPLCLRDRVVIQLASINPLLLGPGDFYLQVAPFSAQAARIVVCSLLEEERREVEETPVPETSYPSIFTEDWLRELNEGRHGTPLARCLLCTDQGVVKVPWAQVANPEFLDKPRAAVAMASSSSSSSSAPPPQPDPPAPAAVPSPLASSAFSVETRILPAKDGIAVSLRLVDSSCSRLVRVDQAWPAPKPVGWVSPNTWDSRNHHGLEGEYVELLEFAKEKEALTHGRTWAPPRTPAFSPARLAPPAPPTAVPRDRTPCARTVRFAEDPCTPCMRRKLGQDAKAHELKCRYRESYLEAQQHPVSFARGSAPGGLEEAAPRDGSLGPEGGRSVPGPPPCCHPPQHHCQGPAVSSVSCGDSGAAQTKQQKEEASPDLRETVQETVSPLPPTVVGMSEQCFVVVQGQESESNGDMYAEMAPRLHVVQGKKTTAFGLVSPKIDRRRHPKQDGTQDGKDLSPVNGQRADTQLRLQMHQDAQAGAATARTRVPSPAQAKAATPNTRVPSPAQADAATPNTRVPSPAQADAATPNTRVPSPAQADAATPNTRVPSPVSSKSSMDLLQSGIACLPGSRDRAGRAVVEIYGDHEGWSSIQASSSELCLLLLYFHSITRKEVREHGLTLVFDARRRSPHPEFSKALLMLREQALHAVHGVLLVVDKDASHSLEKCPGLPMDAVPSLKALHKMVGGSRLTSALEGTYPYSHSDWLVLHQKLHPFVSDLQEASGLLQGAIRRLEGIQKTDNVQEVQQCIKEQRTLMRDVLKDTRLVALQREGGANLARLRRESDLRYLHCEDSRAAMDTVTCLYDQLEEQVHVLVRRSNMALQHLDFLLQLRDMEAQFTKIKEWFNAEGERRLLEAESVEDSCQKVEQTLQSFNTFLSEAKERKHQAMMLVTESERIQGPCYPETEVFRTMVCTFKSSLADFLSRAERCCNELGTMVSLCHFCETATELAKDCRQCLEQEQPGPHPEKHDRPTLQRFRECFGEFSPERFQEVKAQACALRGSRGMRVWNVAWLKCQEVRQQLEERLHDLEVAQEQSAPLPVPCNLGQGDTAKTGHPVGGLPKLSQLDWERTLPDPTESRHRRARENGTSTVTCFNINFRPDDKACRGPKATQATRDALRRGAKNDERAPRKEAPCRGGHGAVVGSDAAGCEWYPWQHGLSRSVSEGSSAASCCSKSQVATPACCHGQPSCRILQAAQRFQISRHSSFCSEDSCCEAGCTGTATPSAGTAIWRCEGTTSLASPEESSSNVLKLQRVMDELLVTEREYVRSMGYTLTHYLPLLARPDVPQDLRGQRAHIFGNLEKLHDFHRHHFLQEMEACQQEPLKVARCFLRHKESFGLYALYSKNKPQSDALVLNHRRDFFKRKQQELGDSMDLSSYLLKPVQRISKYSLLLKDMLAECGLRQHSERAEIQAAMEVVRFQLRHGNDLLTMDAIQDCDVNLKEQGQLIRQDEFCVFFRKKKCFRRIFLFQDLILFSKTKKTDPGNEVYIYKQSFKTSDIGMTHNTGESGLCFEIWFRRRKSQDTYTLQAERAEMKEAWTRDLERILWDQAVRSRELRMKERVFMGMGSKPFMDIQPSEAAISDRAVNCVLPGREAKGSSAPVVSGPQRELVLLRPDSIGSGSSASTSGSHSSSSSGRGSLPPVCCPGNQAHGGGRGVCSAQGAVLEDESDHRNPCHHLLMDSTESSGERVSVFSGSDRSCLSAIGRKVEDSSSVSSLCSKTSVSCATTPHFHNCSSPASSRKKPSIAPKPLASSLSSRKVKETISTRKSTEV